MKIRDEVRDEVRKICAAHKDEPSPLMVVLEEVQKKYGYVAMEVQTLISEEMGIPVAEIYGVVTFYNFFSLAPKGKYVINVCLGTACYVKGSQPILDKFNEVLGIKEGQTTKDGFFTLEAVRCMGACALAPAVNVNGKVYPQVKVGQVEQIVAEYRAKEAA